MTVTFHALALLCALGAAVCAAAAARSTRDLAALSAGFAAAALAATPDRLPDAALVGLLAAGAAAVWLFRPRFALLAALVGGALAGLWTALLEVMGLPSPVAVAVAAAVLVVPVQLVRSRPAFAPDAIRDEALLATGALGLGVAILPGVLDGWGAAANLAGPVDTAAAAPVPAWTVALLGMSALLGVSYSVWSRR